MDDQTHQHDGGTSDMSNEDIAILAQQDMHTLARWWCMLNSWGWPDAIPNPEPEHYFHGGRRSQLMGWISEAIGHREISREWNRHMNDEQFNDFWRGVYEGHAPSYARYQRYLTERAEAFGT